MHSLCTHQSLGGLAPVRAVHWKLSLRPDWADAQPRTFGEKHAGEMSPSTAARGFLASQCWDFILVSWSGAWGVGAAFGGIERMFHEYCPAVDDKAFAIEKKKGNGWCFMRYLIGDHSTWVREVGKEDFWPREENFCKIQSCRNIWHFSWAGEELEKSIGVAPSERSLFYLSNQKCFFATIEVFFFISKFLICFE